MERWLERQYLKHLFFISERLKPQIPKTKNPKLSPEVFNGNLKI